MTRQLRSFEAAPDEKVQALLGADAVTGDDAIADPEGLDDA